jgi:hypothetical protein
MFKDDIEFINKTYKHILVVEYAMGSAGNLVQRIIGIDKQFYWDKEINNTKEELNPLEFPDSGFLYQEHMLTAAAQQYTCHTGYCAVLVQGLSSDLHINTKLLAKAVNKQKKLILRTHADVRDINKEAKVVRVVGDKLSRNFTITRDPFTPRYDNNTYNLNINNLLSQDYEIFKKEYLQLCSWLNLSPSINKVRAFILLWAELQKRKFT